VSAGCAVIDRSDPTRESLLGLADERLFMAKRAGRNRVVAEPVVSKPPGGGFD